MIRLPVFILEPKSPVMVSVAHTLGKDPQIELFTIQTPAELEQWMHATPTHQIQSDHSLLLVYAPDTRVLVKHLTVVRALLARPSHRKIQPLLILKKDILNAQVKVPDLILAGFQEVVTDEVGEQAYQTLVARKVEALKTITSNREFSVPAPQLSADPGDWDFVSSLGSHGKQNYYIYIADEVRTGRVAYVRALPKYWVFIGEKPPVWSLEGVTESGDWICVGGVPQVFEKYGLLPVQVQAYLRDFKQTPLTAEQVERRVKKKEKKRAPDFQIEMTAVAAKKRIFENTSELTEEEKKRAAQVMEALGPISKSVSASRATEPEGVENLGPSGVHAQEPPGPTVSALALAFLASELMYQASKEQALTKYCAYVSSSCGGLLTEVWAEAGGVSKCLGTSDGSPGSLEELIPIFSDGAKLYGELVVGAPILSLDSARNLGVLMLRGDGVETVPPEYVASAGEMIRGFLED